MFSPQRHGHRSRTRLQQKLANHRVGLDYSANTLYFVENGIEAYLIPIEKTGRFVGDKVYWISCSAHSHTFSNVRTEFNADYSSERHRNKWTLSSECLCIQLLCIIKFSAETYVHRNIIVSASNVVKFSHEFLWTVNTADVWWSVTGISLWCIIVSS